MRKLILVLMAACGADQTATMDAGVAAMATCGDAPMQPEIPIVISTVDDQGRPAVLVQRPYWDEIVNYEIAIRDWTQCMGAH